MLFIYVSLRYHSQLARICPEVVDSFKSLVVSSARKNGGVDFSAVGATLCCFDERAVGFSFSASRTIADIRAFLAANRVRIREYFIVAGVSGGPVTGDTIGDIIAPYTALIVPDESVLVTKEAMACLGPYIVVEPVGNIGLMSCVSSVIAEADVRERSSSLRKRPQFSFHAGFVRDPVQVFRNLAASAKSRCSPERLAPEEREAFEDTAHALEMYSRSRFDPNQSEFRIGACLEHFVLFFRAAQDRPDEKVPVTIYGTKPLPPSFDVFLERLDPVCSFIRLPDPECLPFDLKAMPDDLLELTWLVYRAVQFLDADEFKPFFADLGKNEEFSASLGIWLYSFGVLADPDDFTSIQSSPYFRMESRLGERTKKLDRQLAQYLWKRHGEGFFLPSFAFADVLERLSFVPPDSFLVSCLYQERDAEGGLALVRGKIADPETASAVEMCAEAWRAYGSGDLQSADARSRAVLHSFQRGHVLAGEYRALTLVALVCLARNNPDDAIVYLEFARENAEAMHDPRALLSTRFETALVHFILGNYHVALCTLDTVDRILVSCFAKDWLSRVLFLRARVFFELGDYRNSETLFASAAEAATASQIPEAIPLCDAWRARSLVYQNRFASGQDMLRSSAAPIPEIPLFLLEACVLSGRAIEGFSAPDRLQPADGPASCRSAGDLAWASGFSMAEDRCFVGSGEQRVASRMYDAFRAYWASRSVPDASAIVGELASRARAAADLKDPYAGIYYFFAYDVASRDSDNRNPDAAGYLSRAFKYLQKRANAIDDNALREQYMQTPVWNGRLYRAARENMLI
jgi:hypothetical protein